jgi:hypothetical protein
MIENIVEGLTTIRVYEMRQQPIYYVEVDFGEGNFQSYHASSLKQALTNVRVALEKKGKK